MNDRSSEQVVLKAEPRDIFLHLLAMVTLYASGISFLVLVFQLINYFVQDQLEAGMYYRESVTSAARFAIASLVVVFPTYLFTTKYLNKNYEQSPAKRNLRIRKWLIYFTLFIAALIIIGDLVGLINGFLQGDLTLRFALKVLAVAFVAGSVFYYYFTDVRKYA